MTAPTIDEAPAVSEPQTASGRRERVGRDGRTQIYRHTVWVRVGHWLNVLALTLLLFSGLQIFNAHPHLYWGQYGANAAAGPDHAWLSIDATRDKAGKDHGTVRMGQLTIRTTGVFGVSKRADGSTSYRAFPRWMTVPGYTDLSQGRHFHFFFAWIFVLNGLVFWAYGFLSRHFQRDIAPTAPDLRGIGRSIVDHVKLKHPTGEAATRYNVLQKLAYIAVIFVFLPGMVLTGLTMSPGFDAFFPWLLDLFGGRQSARSLHFICAGLTVGFIIVHLVEVMLAGPINEVRSIITGWYGIRPDHPVAPPPVEETPAVEARP
ncbi:MAG: HupC/HyaC/HydC family protein [Caulobacter sp.]|nr:HupC/HyaC/HydC family protein [Caulobacter sp.]